MKRFIIVGLGNFGAGVAETLHAQGHEVSAVDMDEEAVDRIAPFVSQAAVGDGRDLRILERVGVKNADAGVVSTGDNITASILSSLALKEPGGAGDLREGDLARPRTGDGEDRGHGDHLPGARVCAPAGDADLEPGAPQLHPPGGRASASRRWRCPTAGRGARCGSSACRSRYGISVVAVHDVLTDTIVSVPDPDAPLKESDTLLIAGRDTHLQQVAQVA